MITASIGISAYPDDGHDAQSLLKAADIAMYRAKEAGKNNFQYYSPQMNVHSFERLTMEANLRRALERGEFLLHYQPKIDLRTRRHGRRRGVDALAASRHGPGLADAIHPARRRDRADRTDRRMGAAHRLRSEPLTWQEQGLPPLRMAVNISRRQFRQAEAAGRGGAASSRRPGSTPICSSSKSPRAC